MANPNPIPHFNKENAAELGARGGRASGQYIPKGETKLSMQMKSKDLMERAVNNGLDPIDAMLNRYKLLVNKMNKAIERAGDDGDVEDYITAKELSLLDEYSFKLMPYLLAKPAPSKTEEPKSDDDWSFLDDI
ncbi:hypothetical protein [Endozoicomonas sp. ALB115]|uniref:hypothetical protein n=1 Tax=Endozoicomonas sp. ALB115 TaxID=3403074 RepID=UPI003BB625C3